MRDEERRPSPHDRSAHKIRNVQRDLTAEETPEATDRLGDPTVEPQDKDPTAEAIAMAGKIRSGS